MFSGIIMATGSIVRADRTNGDVRVIIDAGAMTLADVSIGDSISVNGVCLTVVAMKGNTFTADISAETLACTTFAALVTGMRVNLEKALQTGDRLNGHFVTGHIDGTGTVISITPDARSMRYVIKVPVTLQCYICKKGSICVDGVSLTVNEVSGQEVAVNLIPFTLENTILADYMAGTPVNIEVDIIARYLERLQDCSQ